MDSGLAENSREGSIIEIGDDFSAAFSYGLVGFITGQIIKVWLAPRLALIKIVVGDCYTTNKIERCAAPTVCRGNES